MDRFHAWSWLASSTFLLWTNTAQRHLRDPHWNQMLES